MLNGCMGGLGGDPMGMGMVLFLSQCEVGRSDPVGRPAGYLWCEWPGPKLGLLGSHAFLSIYVV